ERVGIHDDFFALGGHSLRALMVLARIRKAFDVVLALRVLFETPTVAGLAERVDALRAASTAVLPTIAALAPQESYAVSAAQRRL
ncbi:hypothetical protein KVP70_33895, partial [Duganella sp. HSC-15S17]